MRYIFVLALALFFIGTNQAYAIVTVDKTMYTEVFTETFDDDPQWPTDISELVNWNEDRKSITFELPLYLDEGDTRDRFYLNKIQEFDPTQNFQITWRQKIVGADGAGNIHFGMYSDDHLNKRISLFNTPLSTISGRMSYNTNFDSSGYGLKVNIGVMGRNLGGSSSFILNNWYRMTLTYDQQASTTSLLIVDEVSDETIIDVSREIDRFFDPSMQYVGVSSHPSRKIPKDSEQSSIAVELDDVIVAYNIVPPEPPGASNVLFLPGIQASRLYAGEDILLPEAANNVEAGDKLWELTNDKRIATLAMDKNGNSIYDIYTKDIIEEVQIVGFNIGSNIYKSFISMLDSMKIAEDGLVTDEKVFVDYHAFAYDWRYSLTDIATKPVQYENQTKLLKNGLLALASTSRTGKVTIIGHSNGGLVGKALLHAYGDNELKGKVDKLVMIGTPQLGTPKGITAMLHGQVLDGVGGFFTRDPNLRKTVRNIPGAYTLMPSPRYMTDVLKGPLVTVPDGYDLSIYNNIRTRNELNALLLDTANVVGSEPPINEPLKLNQDILRGSSNENTIFDQWQAPEGVEVYEVAGTGIPTPAAISYEEVPVKICEDAAAVTTTGLCFKEMILKPKIEWSNNGDETVMLGSAQAHQGTKTTAKIDLVKTNNLEFFDKSHSNLTEVVDSQIFLKSVIKYPYIQNVLDIPNNTDVTKKYTIHAGHSPVELQTRTSDGRVTGMVNGELKKEIPGAHYITLAGSSYVIIPDSVTDYTLTVIGTGNGVFTLETIELTADDVQSTLTSFVASTTDTMIATVQMNGGVQGNLESDYDNDGIIDAVVTPAGKLLVEHNIAAQFADLKSAIKDLNASIEINAFALRPVEQAEGYALQTTNIKRNKRLAKRFLTVTKSIIEWYVRAGYITVEEGDSTLLLISDLRGNI